MANRVHVQLLRQGAGAVQKWRNQFPEEMLDLSDCGFEREFDCRGVNLSGANLTNTRLAGLAMDSKPNNETEKTKLQKGNCQSTSYDLSFNNLLSGLSEDVQSILR